MNIYLNPAIINSFEYLDHYEKGDFIFGAYLFISSRLRSVRQARTDSTARFQLFCFAYQSREINRAFEKR